MSGYIELPDGQLVAIKDSLTIGRVAGNDIVLADAKSSRRHARVVVEVGVVEIEDLGSSNGTFLNGKKVERRMLRDGDELQIGKSKLTYRAEVAVPPAADDLGSDAEQLADPRAVEAKRTQMLDKSELHAGGDDVDIIEFEDEVVQVERPAVEKPVVETIEFEDEVVVVEKPATPERSSESADFDDEVVQLRRRELPGDEPPARGARKRQIRGIRGTTEHGVLQFNRRADSTGVLQDDVGQLGGLPKLGLVLLALAIAGGLGYLAMVLTQ